MKAYLFKTSILSALVVALVPLAYAKGRKSVEGIRSKNIQQRLDTMEITNPELARFLRNYQKQGEQGQITTPQPNSLLRVTTANAVNKEEVVEAVLTLSEMSGVVNGTVQAVADFMNNPSNVRIAQELVSMSKAHPDTYHPQSVANSVRYVANIKGTAISQGGVSTGNVLRAVGNHLSKVVNWGAKPKATYNTFMSTYNQAIQAGKSKSRALDLAIATAFGLKGEAIARKKQEVLQYCRA